MLLARVKMMYQPKSKMHRTEEGKACAKGKEWHVRKLLNFCRLKCSNMVEHMYTGL
jgi:hypothetical protein